MRLPDDYEDHGGGLTPTVISAIVAVTIFVAVILTVVLIMNRQPTSHQQNNTAAQTENVQQAGNNQTDKYPDTQNLITGSTLTPSDLDFWDMYPETTATPLPSADPSQKDNKKETAEADPSTDGKHTLVTNRDGKEEWVLISPYLPKHEYDFTKLVCQSDLMKYYQDGKLTSYVGVDISKYQDYVDFLKLKKAGVDFVMLRVGARGYGSGQIVLDDYFVDNIKRATDAGLQIGVYFTSQAITEEEAVEESNIVLENIKDYKITYPVAFDMSFVDNDTTRIETVSRADKTKITKAFLDTIEAAGYKPLLYGDKEWLIKEIDLSKLSAYDVWLSQMEDVPDYPYRFTMWQYANDVTIDGIIVANSNCWNVNSYSSKHVEINNVKVISGRQNGDGFTFQSCTDHTVTNSFARTWDDSLVIKNYSGSTKGITFRNMQVWTDLAQSMEIGYETDKGWTLDPEISDVLFENITVLYNFHKPVISIHNSDDAYVHAIVYRNVVVENAFMQGDNGNNKELIEMTLQNSAWSTVKDEFGSIDDVLIDGLTVLRTLDGKVPASRLSGYGEDNRITNVTLRNVTILGEKMTNLKQMKLRYDDYCEGIVVE